MTSRGVRLVLGLALLLGSGSASQASPITVVSVTPTSNLGSFTRLFPGLQEVWSTEWTQTDTYANVDITALLRAHNFVPSSGTAYLTTQVGPGTTAAQQVASGSYTAPGSESDVTIFSGLTLGPGTYYLTLTGPVTAVGDEINWRADLPANIVTAAGVTADPRALCSVQDGPLVFAGCGIGVDTSFAPASSFVDFNTVANPQPLRLAYKVTGDLVPVPEPMTLVLTGLGVSLLWRRRAD